MSVGLGNSVNRLKLTCITVLLVITLLISEGLLEGKFLEWEVATVDRMIGRG